MCCQNVVAWLHRRTTGGRSILVNFSRSKPIGASQWRRNPHTTADVRSMARVRIDAVTGCWIWTGPTSGTKGRGAGCEAKRGESYLKINV
jgi:hypothetical protein